MTISGANIQRTNNQTGTSNIQNRDTASQTPGKLLFQKTILSSHRETLIKHRFEHSNNNQNTELADQFIDSAGRDGIIQLSQTPDGQHALKIVYDHAGEHSREFMKKVQEEQGFTAVCYTDSDHAPYLITNRSSISTNIKAKPLPLPEPLMNLAKKYASVMENLTTQKVKSLNKSGVSGSIDVNYRKFINLLHTANNSTNSVNHLNQYRSSIGWAKPANPSIRKTDTLNNSIKSQSAESNSWRVDQENKTVYLDNGYRLVCDGKECGWKLLDDEGKVLHVFGDPHVRESDGGKWDFKADMTFKLEDGTKITVQTKDWGNGMTVSDNLIITKDNQCVQVTGIAADKPVISEVTNNGEEMDAKTDDGYVASEMGGVDDWSLNGNEITHNLPFVDYQTYLDGMHYHDILDFFSLFLIDLSSAYSEEIVNQNIDGLKEAFKSELAKARNSQNNTDTYYDKKFYEDYIQALEGDIKTLDIIRNTGDLKQRATLLNNLCLEATLELRYNIVLSVSKNDYGPVWNNHDLQQLQTQFNILPTDFSLFNPQLSQIGISDLPEGTNGMNYGRDGIKIRPNNISYALIHEIGHYYDANSDNALIQEFKEISGWRDVTSEFVSTSISSDYAADESYIPFEGTAELKRDKHKYTDGDKIDLNGDGIFDGIIQVHYGLVMVHDISATFARKYGGTAPREDFATCFNYFFNHPSQLKADVPEKYEFMVKYTGFDPLAVKPLAGALKRV
ncbi:MAG: DUF1521 domain-containing protein [Candidatus Thiodiazotropha sp.]|jgi:hypothetical protein